MSNQSFKTTIVRTISNMSNNELLKDGTIYILTAYGQITGKVISKLEIDETSNSIDVLPFALKNIEEGYVKNNDISGNDDYVLLEDAQLVSSGGIKSVSKYLVVFIDQIIAFTIGQIESWYS